MSVWRFRSSGTAHIALDFDLCLKCVRRHFEGCGMGPWFVLVSSCFRENVVATCKIGSFLCSLDNLLQKNVSFSFFLKSNFKMVLI